MENTTNYGLKTYESGDLFNPLTTNNYNAELIDTALKAVSDLTIAPATELVSQGVHAITILDTDAKVFRFVATANFTAGETFTVNGVQVNCYTPSGATLGTGSYITGAVVIGSLNADNSAITLYVPEGAVVTASNSERLGGELPSYFAKESDMTSAESSITSLTSFAGRKALVNTYYNSSTKKLYEVNADGTQGGEITVNKELDFSNKTAITTNNYTTQKSGIIAGCAHNSSNNISLYIDDTIFMTEVNNSLATFFTIPDIPTDTKIRLSTSNGTGRILYFIPYV